MEKRSALRSRYGGDLGSVKSRIQAREGSSATGASDIEKLKQARLKSDQRTLRNAEGIRSRMNKFSEKVSTPTTNGSPANLRKKRDTPPSDKVQKSVNGDVNPLSRRAARNTERKTPTDTETKAQPVSISSRKEKTNPPEEKVNPPEEEVNPPEEKVNPPEEEVNPPEEKDSSPEVETETFSKKNCETESDRKNGSPPVSPAHGSPPVSPAHGSNKEEEEEESITGNGHLDDTPDVETPPQDGAEDESSGVQVNRDVTEETRAHHDDSPATSPSPDTSFISAFAAPRKHGLGSDVAANSVTDDVTPGEEKTPVVNDVIAISTENEQSVVKEAKSLQLNGLNADSPDDTSSRRRRRGRRGVESARSSEASSAVSTPDREHSTPDTPKSIQSQASSRSGTPLVEVDNDPENIKVETTSHVSDVVISPANDEDPKPVLKEEEEGGEVEVVEVSPASVEMKEEKVSKTSSESVDAGKEEVTKDEETTRNASSTTFTIENVEECKDLAILDKMLYEASEYEERRKIRAVIRALKKSGVTTKPKATSATDSKAQNRTTKTGVRSEPATARSTKATKEIKSDRIQKSGLLSSIQSKNKENKTPPDPKALAEKYGLSSNDKKEAAKKKVGSIFDREEEAPKKSSSRLDMERRQAERKREMMRNRAPPSTAASKDARKKFVAQLEVDGSQNSPGTQMVKGASVVPNSNNIKSKLLKWCQSKTRGYENVDISNYSTSWADGLSFCALIHHFFPDAFDFSELNAKDRSKNFNLAFDTAEKRADIPRLLDVSDLVQMDEPDWKCIYTYLTEFYKHLYELGMT